MSTTTIPQLPMAISLDGSEQIEIVQAGVSRRATISLFPPGPTGDQGNKGGLAYAFSTTTTAGTSANGELRYNNTTIASVTALYINANDVNGTALGAFIAQWDDSSTTTNYGQLVITGEDNDSAVVNVFNVTGAVVNNTTYYTVPVTYVSGSLPTNTLPIAVQFSRTGDKGVPGSVTSVAFSGGTTGLTVTGSPITGSGTITLQGTLGAANGGTGITSLGTGVATALGVNVGSAGAFLTYNGAGGTPSAITLTNGTGLPLSTGISGFGTGVATALAVNIGSAGAPVLFNGAGGTPSSLTLTNATGLPLTTGVTGTLAVGSGGTGQTTYTDGQLLIGNSAGNTLTKATLTQGAGVTITNGGGSITIAAAGGTWTSISVLNPSSGTTATFAAIPQTYTELLIVGTGLKNNSGGTETLQFDIDTGSGYTGSPKAFGEAFGSGGTVRGISMSVTGYTKESSQALANSSSNTPSIVTTGQVSVMLNHVNGLINLRFSWSGGAAFAGGATPVLTLYGK